MKFISLGQGCLAAFHLRAYGLKNQETHFFDWIVASQKTVVEVFSIPTEKDLRTALSTDVEFEDELFEGHKAFRCKRFDLLRSVHDLPPNGDRTDLFQAYFVDKYARRYVRLMDELTTTTKPVVFVMTNQAYHDAEHEETLRLMDLWNIRFPSLRYHLVVFVETTCDTRYSDTDNMTWIRIQDYLLAHPPSVVHWYLNQYDWKRMFTHMLHKVHK